MTTLTRTMHHMVGVLGVVGAAISTAAALRLTLRPGYDSHGAVRFPETDTSVRF
jgi:hypothetical protein